jgi:hypothetical protein
VIFRGAFWQHFSQVGSSAWSSTPTAGAEPQQEPLVSLAEQHALAATICLEQQQEPSICSIVSQPQPRSWHAKAGPPLATFRGMGKPDIDSK